MLWPCLHQLHACCANARTCTMLWPCTMSLAMTSALQSRPPELTSAPLALGRGRGVAEVKLGFLKGFLKALLRQALAPSCTPLCCTLPAAAPQSCPGRTPPCWCLHGLPSSMECWAALECWNALLHGLSCALQHGLSPSLQPLWGISALQLILTAARAAPAAATSAHGATPMTPAAPHSHAGHVEDGAGLGGEGRGDALCKVGKPACSEGRAAQQV